MKAYPVTHQKGLITIENLPDQKILVGDLGVQIASDGRVWVCINGSAFLRFKPMTKAEKKAKIVLRGER